MTGLIEQIVEELKALPETDLETIRAFVAFLTWKQSEPVAAESQPSAEARAMQRLDDVDHPEQWVSIVAEGEEINPAVYDRLQQQGYEIQIPAEEA